MNFQKKISFIAFIFFLAANSVYAQESNKKENKSEELSYSFSTGYYHYNVKGYRGKVGEYDPLDTGVQSDFKIQGRRGKNYFEMHGNIIDKRDQEYKLDIDIKRQLRSNFLYRRYRHYLDHDPLENQDSHTDFDISEDNGITIEEIQSKNTFYIPYLPFLKVKADYRKYSKRGHRQATTVSKCSSCHVSSRNQRINSDLDDIRVGVESRIGTVLLNYEHLWRDYRQQASTPLNNYGRGSSLFAVTGKAPYSSIPDSSTDINRVRISSPLPYEAAFSADYQWGEKRNTDSRNRVRFNSFAGSLYKRFSSMISSRFFYNNYRMDNDSPGGFERNVKRGGLTVNTRIMKQTVLRGLYQWENINRNNYNEGTTNKRIYRVTLNHRVARKIRFHAKYKKVKTDDPFVARDNDFSGLVQTSLPSSEDDFSVSLNWTPRSNFSLTTAFRFYKATYDHYNLDENRYEYSVSAWYVPWDKLTVTGAFTIFKNEVDTSSSYKTYHMRGLQSLIIFDDVPYDEQSRIFSVQVTYQFTPRVSMSTTFHYTTSKADFDTMLDKRNVGEFSDMEINELETSFGLTYVYSQNVTMYARYQFKDYNDRKDNYLDGQYSLIGAGVNWSF